MEIYWCNRINFTKLNDQRPEKWSLNHAASLSLEKVLEKLPNVKFYWVGDGPFRKEILSRLEKYKNFEWLGILEYPNKVRKYLSEIDIFALVLGLDMLPLTILEAQLMNKNN